MYLYILHMTYISISVSLCFSVSISVSVICRERDLPNRFCIKDPKLPKLLPHG